MPPTYAPYLDSFECGHEAECVPAPPQLTRTRTVLVGRPGELRPLGFAVGPLGARTRSEPSFSPGRARFFRAKFVRGTYAMGGDSPFACELAYEIRVQRGKAALRFASGE